jgi:hypothetical protein
LLVQFQVPEAGMHLCKAILGKIKLCPVFQDGISKKKLFGNLYLTIGLNVYASFVN